MFTLTALINGLITQYQTEKDSQKKATSCPKDSKKIQSILLHLLNPPALCVCQYLKHSLLQGCIESYEHSISDYNGFPDHVTTKKTAAAKPHTSRSNFPSISTIFHSHNHLHINLHPGTHIFPVLKHCHGPQSSPNLSILAEYDSTTPTKPTCTTHFALQAVFSKKKHFYEYIESPLFSSKKPLPVAKLV